MMIKKMKSPQRARKKVKPKRQHPHDASLCSVASPCDDIPLTQRSEEREFGGESRSIYSFYWHRFYRHPGDRQALSPSTHCLAIKTGIPATRRVCGR